MKVGKDITLDTYKGEEKTFGKWLDSREAILVSHGYSYVGETLRRIKSLKNKAVEKQEYEDQAWEEYWTGSTWREHMEGA